MRAYGRRIGRKIPLDAAANDIVGYFRIDFSLSKHVFWRSAAVLVRLGERSVRKTLKYSKSLFVSTKFHRKSRKNSSIFNVHAILVTEHERKKAENKEKIRQRLNPPSVLDA
jgi:hypothetical protein